MELGEWLGGSEALAALDAAHDAAWNTTDAELLALCENRVAMLLRHAATLDRMTDDERAELRDWPTSSRFSDRERTALDFTEQYIVDVASLTDGQAGALHEHLGDQGLADFVNSLLVVEQRMTLELAFASVL